jgi:hypothetical protein
VEESTGVRVLEIRGLFFNWDLLEIAEATEGPPELQLQLPPPAPRPPPAVEHAHHQAFESQS